jgi:hypothetical protein
VGVAALYWKWKRYAFRLAPGHWLAFEVIFDWAYSLLATLVLVAPWFLGVASVVGKTAKLLILVGYIGLPIWSSYPRYWRLTFVAVAFASSSFTIGNLLKNAGMSIEPYAMQVFRTSTLLAASTLLTIAMAIDLRRGDKQHWSHWLAGASRLVATIAAAAVCVYVAFRYG